MGHVGAEGTTTLLQDEVIFRTVARSTCGQVFQENISTRTTSKYHWIKRIKVCRNDGDSLF